MATFQAVEHLDATQHYMVQNVERIASPGGFSAIALVLVVAKFLFDKKQLPTCSFLSFTYTSEAQESSCKVAFWHLHLSRRA